MGLSYPLWLVCTTNPIPREKGQADSVAPKFSHKLHGRWHTSGHRSHRILFGPAEKKNGWQIVVSLWKASISLDFYTQKIVPWDVFCLITKSFWGFFALNLGPDCSINSHKLTYNSHCSIWRWYHTCARFISVFPWKYISRSYGRIWHASFFPAMLYTSVVRVTLHPIPIPSFPIIPSLCAKVTFINLVPASEPPTMSNLGNFHGEKTAVLHGGGFNLATSATSIQLPSWERSHIPDTNGTFESMMFLFSQGGICFFPWRVYNFCILKMVWFLVRLQITYLLAHYFRYARRLSGYPPPSNQLFDVRIAVTAWHINHRQVHIHISHSPGALIP